MKKKPRPSRYHPILKNYVASVKMLDTDFIQCIKSAEEKNFMSLVKKGNTLKRRNEERKWELDILLNEVKNLKEKRRKLISINKNLLL